MTKDIQLINGKQDLNTNLHIQLDIWEELEFLLSIVVLKGLLCSYLVGKTSREDYIVPIFCFPGGTNSALDTLHRSTYSGSGP